MSFLQKKHNYLSVGCAVRTDLAPGENIELCLHLHIKAQECCVEAPVCVNAVSLTIANAKSNMSIDKHYS